MRALGELMNVRYVLSCHENYRQKLAEAPSGSAIHLFVQQELKAALIASLPTFPISLDA